MQVLSETVGKAIELTGEPETEETSKFIFMFDKFFDILNVNSFQNWARARKPFQRPYYCNDDDRLTVHYISKSYVVFPLVARE